MNHGFAPFLLPMPYLYGITLGLESAQSPPSPACKLIGLAYLLVSILLQPVRQFEEGAQQRRAIIVHQLDQPGLLDQAAELNQVSCARTPVLHPLAGVIASTIPIETVTQHGQAL